MTPVSDVTSHSSAGQLRPPPPAKPGTAAHARAASKHAQLSRNLNRDKRAAKQMAILVSCFAFCWLPYTTAALVNSFCKNCVPEAVFEVVFWLLWMNSTINPLLYSFVNDAFREAFKDMLCGRGPKPGKAGAKAKKAYLKGATDC